MNTLTALKIVQLSYTADREVMVVHDRNGFSVKLRTNDDTDTFLIDNADAENVEMLSTVFAHEQVCVFKVVVEMLGWMVRTRRS